MLYRDHDAPIEQRVEDLLQQMTLEEKAGQMFQTMMAVGPGGTLSGPIEAIGLPSPEEMIFERHLTHFNAVGNGSPSELAEWSNRLQTMAASTRLGIPISISTDPRHAFTRNIGTGATTSAFSTWPEALGLAAIGDPAVVERFADICRQEYRAVGIHVALHPQLDLATEPRWARIIGTFGEDPERVSRLGVAYVRGLQGDGFGASSVSAMIKHFPGGGPLRDGEDSHFPTGSDQIYPGGRFAEHLQPFRDAIGAGARQVMPSYGKPLGLGIEEIACGFNRALITDLLRDEIGFDGVVCTDWGLLNDISLFGEEMPARAWGAEHLSVSDRVLTCLRAGVDQFGGEQCPELIVELVRSGNVDETRLDTSVRRLLREKFALGLFDGATVDVERAAAVAGSDTFRADGRRAQSQSVTVLTNGQRDSGPLLPLHSGLRVFVDGLDADLAGEYSTVVDTRDMADVAIVRRAAPYERRPGGFRRLFHSGSLDWPADELTALVDSLHEVPVVLAIHLDRPAILTEVVEHATAIVATYGCSDAALLDALFGVVAPVGRLPVDLPRSMQAVLDSDTDAPFDTADPLFRHGHGLDITSS